MNFEEFLSELIKTSDFLGENINSSSIYKFKDIIPEYLKDYEPSTKSRLKEGENLLEPSIQEEINKFYDGDKCIDVEKYAKFIFDLVKKHNLTEDCEKRIFEYFINIYNFIKFFYDADLRLDNATIDNVFNVENLDDTDDIIQEIINQKFYDNYDSDDYDKIIYLG